PPRRSSDLKPARIDTGNEIKAVTHVAIDKDVDQDTESTWVLQNRRNVAKGHAGLGPVRNAANCVADVLGRIDIHGRSRPDGTERRQPWKFTQCRLKFRHGSNSQCRARPTSGLSPPYLLNRNRGAAGAARPSGRAVRTGGRAAA